MRGSVTAHYRDPDWDVPELTQKRLPFADRASIVHNSSVSSLKGLLQAHNLEQFVRIDQWKDRPDQVACLDQLLLLSGNIGFQADTGSGKTNLGLLVALAHAKRMGEPAVLFVVPRVDLLPQHAGAACRYFCIDPHEIVQVTGTLHDQSERVALYATPGLKLLCVTPKTLLNDLDTGLRSLSLKKFGAMLIDECHHAQGDHPLGLLIDRMVREHPETKIIGLSATFAETPEAKEALRHRLGRAHYYHGAMKTGSRVFTRYLAQPPKRIVQAAQEIELGIIKSIDRLTEALGEYPNLSRDVRRLHQNIRGLLMTPSYIGFRELRKRVRTVVPKGELLREIENQLLLVQTLCVYYERLVQGGRFRFLDGVARQRAASMYCAEKEKSTSPLSSPEAEEESKKRKAPSPGWIFRLASRGRSLRHFWSSFDEVLKIVTADSPYSILRRLPPELRDLEVHVGIESPKEIEGVPPTRSQVLARINAVFDRMRDTVIEDTRWWDHAKLDHFKSALRALRDKHQNSGKVLVRTALVSDAFFLAEVCRHQMGLRAEAVVSTGHLRPKAREQRFNAFRNDELDVLIGTSLLDEGHDLDKAVGIILYDPVSSGRTRIQVQGRVGRLDATGDVVEIVAKTPREFVIHFAGKAREAKVRKLQE